MYELRALMRSDFDRYAHMLGRKPGAVSGIRLVTDIRSLLLCQGLQASVVHRLGHALWAWQPVGRGQRAVRLVGRVTVWVLNRLVESLTGISISEHASIGPGLYIGHFGGIIVGK